MVFTQHEIPTLAVHFHCPIKLLHVSNAFLQWHLQETIYMEQPQGAKHPDTPKYVCKLHESIYELEQDPRACFHRLSQVLIAFNFTES